MSPSPQKLRDRLAGVTIRDRERIGRRLQRATRRRPAGGSAARELEAIERALDKAEARRGRRLASVPQVSYPLELPVTERREEIMSAIHDHQVVVVAGETGSGKTTQIPKICLELGRGVDGMIGHTQPRRIAARTVAERIAEELAVPLGTAVGYSVRFDDRASDQTLVKVMTDGILLAETRSDRSLSAYDTIIVDEAHERSLNIDFLLGYLTRLLPHRPDLKLVVTSATIDTRRFAAHFDAPVVEVSGRTYPVEIRYRPLDPSEHEDDPDRDEMTGDDPDDGSSADDGPKDVNQAICDAVSELVGEGPGDVLVFLPGERDIRDAAEALRESRLSGIEILPLYARLTAAEQHRVFKPHATRRVVLATNVAETSLTVPGIRYVVDTGLARVSRYNHRTKVQRLPIEPISQASASQRSGRCGRVAPGICIRLYSGPGFPTRPEFTDPEILRTNLASVLLQMATLGLGEVDSFPFIDPPDRRSVADGRSLLEELGAFERIDGASRITATGRRMATIPLDPRLARMVIEAESRGCLREVTVIAAALSIQDPRERPRDKAQAAQENHRRFETTDSDFLAFVRLWDYLAELQSELSGNQFRKRCRAEFLNVLRVREWQDVASQIRQVQRSEGIHANRDPGGEDQIHRALMAGLLSHLGMRDQQRGDYQGARNSRWQIGRDSPLARKRPAWAMAGTLVETDRTWARTVARVDPVWAEGAGAHVALRSYSEPWWDRRRCEALTSERVTLYGLPIVSGRQVSLSRVDRSEARAIFIEQALVNGETDIALPGLDRTEELMEQLEELSRRARRADLLVDGDALYRFYDRHIPDDVMSGRRFQRWWGREQKRRPQLLDVPLTALLAAGALPVDTADYPDRWVAEGVSMPLRYVYRPGAAEDGVTVEVPLGALNRLRPADFEWQVPGRRLELVSTLVRMLPKSVRSSLPPAEDTARLVLDSVGPDDGPLFPTVASMLSKLSGRAVVSREWAEAAIPEHLLMSFEVRGIDGAVLATSRHLRALQDTLAAETRAALAQLAPGVEVRGAMSWQFGELSREIDNATLRAYPGLADEGATVGVRVYDTPAAQSEGMWQGTRRLLLLQTRLPPGHVNRRLSRDTKLVLARSGVNVSDLLRDCVLALIDEVVVAHGGPSFDQVGFETMRAQLADGLTERVAGLATIAGGVLAASDRVLELADRLEKQQGPQAVIRATEDVRRQVNRVVGPGFVSSAGPVRLGEILRYMEAARIRLERVRSDGRRDSERQMVVERVQSRYDALLEQVASGDYEPASAAALAQIRWSIEELRVSLWAQSLGTAGPVSEQRIDRALDAVDR